MQHTPAIVLAYITAGTTVLPDPAVLTHINYAFGVVNNTFDGVIVQHEARLREIAALKARAPRLKLLLSIGGWTAGGFSEMASTPERRAAFSADCARVCAQFGLDGIDLDWEYPTSTEAGIAAAPEDRDNYTALMGALRQALGAERLLTLASYAGAQFIDFAAIAHLIDFVNIMVYDLGRPPFHNAPVFASAMTRKWTCESAVAAHLAAGLPADKLVLGLPFYGHGDTKTLPDFIDYKDIVKLTGFTQHRDPVALVPYLTDAAGAVVCVYDDAESLERKCAFACDQGLRGVMYWEYACDDAQGTLRQRVYAALC
jgi:chitinase